jgi:D-alanine--poly(phosphoribitol) ligase subunit 1
MMIIEKIDQWGKVSPDHIAHRSGGKNMTYGQLIEQSNALASYISEQLKGDKAKSPVVVRGHKKSEMLVGFLAAAKSGHPYVPIDSSTPEERAEKVISSSNAGLVLTEEQIAEIVSSGTYDKNFKPVETSPSDPFYILFTSGSTGEPKGVVINQGNFESFYSWQIEEQHFIEQQEIFLNQAPFTFDVSGMDIYSALTTGSTLVSVTKEDIANPAGLHKMLQEADPTVWVSTPSFAQLCLMEKTFTKEALPNLRKFWFCGETLNSKIAMALFDRFPESEVWNTYGPTEAAVATSSVLITRDIAEKYPTLPIGYAKPNCELLVFDEHDQEVKQGESGQIIIVGDNVGPGYLGRPDLTEKAFFKVDGKPAYRTGDQGCCENGLMFFEGRIDNQIKLHGYRIELDDIESNLESIEGVLRAVVLLKTIDGPNDFLVAFLSDGNPKAQSEFERTKTLKKALAEKLPAYMVPKKFVFVQSFPMTAASGKADRKKLMASIN